MLFSLFAAFFFACSGVCGQRSSSLIGPMKANTLRLAFSSLVLLVWVMLTGGVDFTTVAAQRLMLSGVVGFGLGDMALFFALPRLGARLTLLINLCTAPVFGLFGDMLLVGTRLQAKQVLVCALILFGVCISLLGKSTRSAHTSGSRWVGICAAFIAGAGQGMGAVLSRWAHVVESLQGTMLPSHAETLIRVLPGFTVVALFWWAARTFYKTAPWAVEHPVTGKAMAWVGANALCGAILGVTCFQHALLTASSAVVLSVTATTPILVLPMTAYSEGDVPSARSLLGAFIAVIGVVLLKLGSA